MNGRVLYNVRRVVLYLRRTRLSPPGKPTKPLLKYGFKLITLINNVPPFITMAVLDEFRLDGKSAVVTGGASGC